MRAEIISIGDEMTSGQRLDTNSQWLSQRLGEIGVPVVAHVTVADDLAANVEVFRQAIARADVVISTGGLGPTADDLTREVLAAVANKKLVLNEGQLEHIRGLFARRRGRPMPERNVVQAMFPDGSRPIPNPEGTAPGVEIEIARPDGEVCHLFALPGVPAEMFQMWEGSVRPALLGLGAGQQLLVHRRIKCFGVGESDLEQMLPDLIRRGRDPQVGITVSDATITLRITSAGADEAECRARIAPTEQTIRDCLGTIVFGEEDDELEDAVGRLLAEQGKTLAVSEWGTAGLVSGWLGMAPEAERWFRGGLTIGSAATALVAALATEARQTFGSDYGLAIGPFPPQVPGAEPGEVWFGLASSADVTTKATPFAGHSAILKARTGKQALNLLRLTLLHAG
jgi:nicotinamide-nucleotide amidase